MYPVPYTLCPAHCTVNPASAYTHIISHVTALMQSTKRAERDSHMARFAQGGAVNKVGKTNELAPSAAPAVASHSRQPPLPATQEPHAGQVGPRFEKPGSTYDAHTASAPAAGSVVGRHHQHEWLEAEVATDLPQFRANIQVNVGTSTVTVDTDISELRRRAQILDTCFHGGRLQ